MLVEQTLALPWAANEYHVIEEQKYNALLTYIKHGIWLYTNKNIEKIATQKLLELQPVFATKQGGNNRG